MTPEEHIAKAEEMLNPANWPDHEAASMASLISMAHVRIAEFKKKYAPAVRIPRRSKEVPCRVLVRSAYGSGATSSTMARKVLEKGRQDRRMLDMDSGKESQRQ